MEEMIIAGYFLNAFLFAFSLLMLTGVRNEYRKMRVSEERIIKLLLRSKLRR